MKRYKLILAVIIGAAFFTGGCTKKGDPGPKGDQGANGQNGNSNVSAYTFSINTWAWSAPYYYRNLVIPSITSSNTDSAAIIAYFSTGSLWRALPYTQYDSPYNYYMGLNTTVGSVQVTWFYDFSGSSGSDPCAYYGVTNILVKVVVIPPAHRKANPDLDIRDYKAVKKRFNLTD